MGEEFVPVFQQAVGAAIERVVLREAFVRAQQAGAGRGGKPVAVQTPFAAGGKQPVKREQTQDFLPVRAFAAATQARGEEGVELEIAPELIAQAVQANVLRHHQRLGHMRAGPSTTMTMKSSGWAALACARKTPIASAFMTGPIRQSSSPSCGLTAP